jgi:hypothetical protein
VSVYDQRFYAALKDTVVRSASVVVPLVNEDLKPQSVVDFGCGEGDWLAAFQAHGVSNLMGYDGEHVLSRSLAIPQASFCAMDLEAAVRTPTRFDLAVCLEVAEHLSPEGGRRLVEALCKSADLVLFSAAVPGQGGTHHINEQWLDYWLEAFAQHSYVLHDIYRPRIAYNVDVAWWYRQNLVLFASEHASVRVPAGQVSLPQPGQEWVHIETVRGLLRPAGLLKAFPRSLLEALRRRLE